LLKTALESIRLIAILGEADSSEAEAVEERSLARAKNLTIGTYFLMGFVSLAAMLTGSVVRKSHTKGNSQIGEPANSTSERAA
jgi:hypothetical protein